VKHYQFCRIQLLTCKNLFDYMHFRHVRRVADYSWLGHPSTRTKITMHFHRFIKIKIIGMYELRERKEY